MLMLIGLGSPDLDKLTRNDHSASHDMFYKSLEKEHKINFNEKRQVIHFVSRGKS